MGIANNLKNSYIEWIKKEFVFSDIDNDYVSISTPFIDNDYDNIELFAKTNKNKIIVSDFGETLFKIESYGININRRPNIKKIIEEILQIYSIKCSNTGELTIETTIDDFGKGKTRLLQAIMRINDIPYLLKNNNSISFNDTVNDFLVENKVLFTRNIQMSTNNGVDARFDFSIPAYEDNIKIEKLVRTVARPNDVNQAKIFSFDVEGIAPIRPNSEFILLVNNEKKENNNMEKIINSLDEEVRILGFKDTKTKKVLSNVN